MKKLLFLLLLPVMCNAQLATRIHNADSSQKAQSNAASPFAPITVVPQERDMRDTSYKIMGDMLSLITSSGDLSSVLAAGNVANNTLTLADGTDSTILLPQGIQMWLEGAPSAAALISPSTAGGQLMLKNTSGTSFYGILRSVGLTGNRVAVFPNEGTGTYPNDAITLHRTGIASTWVTGGTSIRLDPVGTITITDGTNSCGIQPFNINFVRGLVSSILDHDSLFITDGTTIGTKVDDGGYSLQSNTGVLKLRLGMISSHPKLGFANAGGTAFTTIIDKDSIHIDDGGVSAAYIDPVILKTTTISGGINYQTDIQPQTVEARDLTNGLDAVLTLAGGTPQMLLSDPISTRHAVFISGTLSSTRTYTSPNHNGELATNDGGSSIQSLTGATTMTITHGATFTPTKIMLTPITALAGASGYYISSIGATTFVVTFAAPVTGSVGFSFQSFN